MFYLEVLRFQVGHVARTITRRAERHTSEVSSNEKINDQALIYLNRLSDLFFVLARITNNNGDDDILWVPGKIKVEIKEFYMKILVPVKRVVDYNVKVRLKKTKQVLK